LNLNFTPYAVTNWAQHAFQSERSIELATAILQTFASYWRRDLLDVGGGYYWGEQRTLLQLIIENRLTFIFISASPSEQLQNKYVFLSMWLTFVKPSPTTFGQRYQCSG
jgi:hypothetical protein